jgi:chromosome segregation ATPase
MEPMTPEERLKAIENLLAALTESQVRREAQIDKHQQEIEKHSAQIERHSAQLEEERAAIRDLIIVSRTTLNSIMELRESQKATDEKLHILIETVDRIIRNQQK